MNTEIQNRIQEWTKEPFDNDTISEIRKLLQDNNTNELEDRFYRQLEFGTGGLRGIIGAGTNRMNRYTTGMASQGLAQYLVKTGNNKNGVVIARDSRHKSDDFAKEAACVFAANSIPVYFFDEIMPVPLASFAIRHLNANAGVVITASHNPPPYNGYKVFWSHGGQIVPPQDQEIINEVNTITSIEMIKSIPFDQGVREGLIKIIGDGIIEDYISKLEKNIFSPGGKRSVTIAYSPIHGTGYRIVPRVLKHFGFSETFTVESQMKPDGSFPTVESPNPEEPQAMSAVVELARVKNADLALASDPDSDRMGVAIKNSEGEFILLNGNQIGSMLLYYMLIRKNETRRLSPDSRVIKTIVTTDLQKNISESFNCAIDEVITGFKWIAEKMNSYEKDKNGSFLFGGEESFGYLCVDFVRDKDAVSSILFFSEMTDWLKKQGKSPMDFLHEIYKRFGLYRESLRSLTLTGIEGMERIKRIMRNFRENPPKNIAGKSVETVMDLERGTIKESESGQIISRTNLPVSNVLSFGLSDGAKVTMRPSGTEPKIKFYFSVNKKAGKDSSIEDEEQELSGYCGELEKALLSIVDMIE